MKIFRRKRQHPGVEIRVTLNGQDVIGPLTCDHLHVIAKYGGYGTDHADPSWPDDILGAPQTGVKIHVRPIRLACR